MTPINRSTRRWRTAAAVLLATVVTALPSASASASAGPEWTPKTPVLSTPWTAEVSPSNALPEYPRPQLVRERWQNLNGVWEFAGAATGEAPPVGQPLAERVLVPYPIESALSGIQRHEDRMWYRRTFTVPSSWRANGQRLLLNFGAVDYDAKVWVNGQLVATHRGGYDSFTADVTAALKGNASFQQELIVWAEDLTDGTQQPIGKQRTQSDHGIFYQGSSGIWQTVWMEPVNAAGAVGAVTLVPRIAEKSLHLTVSAPAGLSVAAVAFNGATQVGHVEGPAGTELVLPVRNPKLWTPDSPFLYDLRVRLLKDGKKTDEVTSYFGMREIGKLKGADGKLRMALNGKILFNMSTLDQGFWPDGLYTAPTDAGLRFDLEQHKVLGFNTVRKHIKVEPARWYYWADKLGLMVWQDMPAMRTGDRPAPAATEQFKAELREMVREHISYPSIVVWVAFNEGWGEWNLADTGKVADEIKAMDPNRLVNVHSGMNCCGSLGDSGRGDIIDYHEYLGPATPMPRGDRVAVDGEHGGMGLEVPGHMWFGEGGAYQMFPTKEALTAKYVDVQRDLLRAANSCGLSGGVYTQITDVEHEVNGFLTYDRQVQKMDFAQVRAVNQAVIRSVTGDVPSTPAQPGTPGLTGVGYWPLDENSGTIAHDDARDHDGTLTGGPTWTAGRSGSALQFGGSAYVDTGAAIVDTAGSYSASAWVKVDSPGDAFQTAVSQDASSNSAFFLQYSGADHRFAMSFAGVRALAPAAPEAGRWYHLTGVRDADRGTLSLYVDGTLAAQVDACASGASAGPLVIGRAKWQGNPVDYWRGALDQVHVFDRALSASEVKELYTSGK
jgi:hypothetical protein